MDTGSGYASGRIRTGSAFSSAWSHPGQSVAEASYHQQRRLHLSIPVPVSPQTARTHVGDTRQAREKEPEEYEELGDT